MSRFLHTADIHLGKTYRTSTGAAKRYEDFFHMLGSIVTDAIAEQVDFVLIDRDLFHTGHILPRTFAPTIETLQPLKDAGIPCIAVEGNHGWIHRRDSISWILGADEKAMILERLKFAREMVGGIDALQWFRSWKTPEER
jgi:DNA repair exonuclease SbcCD nuclease subunit